MRKAALVGLASLVTTTALGEENKNNFGGDAKKNQTEIPAVSPAEKSSECACYVNNLTLDAQSPICQIYKVAAIRRSIHIISTAVPAALSLPGSISVMPMLLAMPIRPVPKIFQSIAGFCVTS